ncbi:MAG: hypothetical protein KF733_03485 [Fimbriimonadaceae bacterium]|nr:MAG: hypothetical protein KF733_03485 [Fimbriimonadaceae bacterium]
MKARLSMAFQDLRGRDGTVVISKTRNGLACRPWVFPTNPNTAPQESARANLSKAARTFKNFTAQQVADWNAFGETQTRTDPVTGEDYTLTGIQAFVELGAKFLQIVPTGILPTVPPTNAFVGDSISLTAVAGTGKVTFTATAGNALGVRTELLLQKLKSKNRKPSAEAYRSKEFFAFATGNLSRDIAVGPGTYAAAYRFVNPLTGQATDLVPLPVVQVTLAVAAGGAEGKKKAA